MHTLPYCTVAYRSQGFSTLYSSTRTACRDRVVTIGDQLSVAHGEKDRFQAKIIAFCPKKGVQVHWVGWSKRYDEIIPRGSDRIWHKLQIRTSTKEQPVEWGHPPSFFDLPETLRLTTQGLGLDSAECAATDVREMWQALQFTRKERLKISVGDQAKYMKVVEELKDTIAKHDPRFADFEVVLKRRSAQVRCSSGDPQNRSTRPDAAGAPHPLARGRKRNTPKTR